MKDIHTYGMEYGIRAQTFDECKMHDFKHFEIINEKENKFISNLKDEEYCIDDFVFLIVYGNVFKDIVKQLCSENYEKGYNQALKDSKTKKDKIQED